MFLIVFRPFQGLMLQSKWEDLNKQVNELIYIFTFLLCAMFLVGE